MKVGETALYMIPVLMLSIGLVLFWDYRADDPYVTFRVARNVVDGKGIVWNPQGPKVDVCTSTLALGFSILAFTIGIDPLLMARIVNFLALFGVATMMSSLAYRETGDCRWVRFWVWTSIIALPACFIQTLNGFYTITFALGIAALLWMPSRWLFLAAVWTFLARPEGVLLGFVVLLLRNCRRQLITFGLFVAVVHLAEFSYFGDALPMSYYFKRHLSSFINLNSIADLARFVGTVAWPMLLLVVLAKVKRSNRSPKRAYIAWAIIAIGLLPYMLFDLRMNLFHRFFMPYYPILVMLAGIALHRLCRSWMGQEKRLAIAIISLALLMPFRSSIDSWVHCRTGLSTYLAEFGIALRDYGSKDGKLALAEAGILPYFCDWETLDLNGMVSPELNRVRWKHNSYHNVDKIEVCKAITAWGPDFVIVPSSTRFRPTINTLAASGYHITETPEGKYMYASTPELFQNVNLTSALSRVKENQRLSRPRSYLVPIIGEALFEDLARIAAAFLG